MKYLVPPISLRSRDWKVARLLRQGSATDDALFEAQYGEWPVRGLDQDTPRNSEVRFKDYWENPTHGSNISLYLMSLGFVSDDDKQRELYLNRFLLSPLGHVFGVFSTRLAWARFHDVAEVLIDGRPSPASLAFLVGSLWSSYRYAVLSSVSQMVTPSIADTVGHEHIHVLQLKESFSRAGKVNFLEAAKKLVGKDDIWTQFKQTADMALSWMPREYYSMDLEIQARLHNIMVQGYRSWGRLPRTENELFAALRDRGIKTPKIERKWLKEAEQKKLRKTFSRFGAVGRSYRGYVNPASAEINIGLNAHHLTEVVEAFWRKYIPSLYADLHVLYGDSKGHQLMGFDRPAIDVRRPNTPQISFVPKS